MEERVFLRAWRRLNRRHSAIDHGFTALELILNTNKLPPHVEGPITERQKLLSSIPSERDQLVAASVIQFLGTKGGCIFLAECEQEIENNKAKQHRAHNRKHNLRPRPI